MEIARAHIYVSGRVQGVYFRAWTEQAAITLGLAGWVWNTEDGRVEAVLEGPKDAVMLAIEKCRQGSPASRVEDVDVNWEAPKSERGFRVRY